MPSAVSIRAQTMSLRRPILNTCASTLRILSVAGSAAAASKGETGSAQTVPSFKNSLREKRFIIRVEPSELKSQRHLQLSWVADRSADDRGLDVPDRGIGLPELWGVENIECLGAKL